MFIQINVFMIRKTFTKIFFNINSKALLGVKYLKEIKNVSHSTGKMIEIEFFEFLFLFNE
jgi:hypothetical protein